MQSICWNGNFANKTYSKQKVHALSSSPTTVAADTELIKNSLVLQLSLDIGLP